MAWATTRPLASVAAGLLGDVDALTDALVDGIAAELPELVEDSQVRLLLHSTVLDNVLTALRIVGGAAPDSEPQAPPVAFDFARRLAQRSIPLTSMLRAYRLGQAAFQQVVLGLLGDADISAAEMMEASMALSAIAFQFIDAVSEQVVVAYQLERDEWLSQRNALRLGQIRSILAGTLTDAHEIETALGVSLAGPLLGAVLWFDHGHGADVTTSTDAEVGALAEALGGSARATVSVAADGSTVWAWLAGCRDGIDEKYAPAAGIHVALGRPGAGVDGFRRTHRQARQVQALALTAAAGEVPALLTSEAAGPLALVGATADDVRGWVAATLGGLAARDDAADRLRETVWSYFSHDSSLNAAAAELHVHKNTVQYRLHRAEEARGRPLHEGRLDVEAALLACRILGDAVLWSADQKPG